MPEPVHDEHVPRCSVVMASYNAERFVAEAIESVLKQTYRDFEFIIVNDGSTDRSLQIIERFAQADSRIRVVTHENRGIGAVRNELLELARGEFVATIDSDDVATPDRLAVQIAFLDAHPEVVCVGGNYELIDEAGRHLITVDDQPLTDDAIQARLLRGLTCINNPTVMIRRAEAVAVGGYDASLAPAEDLDLFLKLGERGKLANLPEILLRYRELGTSASARAHDAQLERMRIATERAWKRRGIEDGTFDAKPWRPVSAREKYERWLKFGWWGFAQGDREHARAYGLKTVALRPWGLRAWTLLLCALFKPMPPKRKM